MKQASDILAKLSEDKDIRRRAEDREARLRLDAMYQRGALREACEKGRDEGRTIGLEEGRQEGRQEGQEQALRSVAARMLSLGASHGDIANALGVDLAVAIALAEADTSRGR